MLHRDDVVGTATARRSTTNDSDGKWADKKFGVGLSILLFAIAVVQRDYVNFLFNNISSNANDQQWHRQQQPQQPQHIPANNNAFRSRQERFATITTRAVIEEDSSNTSQQETTKPGIHILYGMSGNHSGFLSEFEVSLKSVLLNAPVDAALTIHIMADHDAFEALEGMFARMGVSTWETRHPISIETYDIQRHMEDWKQQLMGVVKKAGIPEDRRWELYRHTIGTWFRLFAHQVLPPQVRYVAYIDVDVVVMANLQDLWRDIGEPRTTGNVTEAPAIYWGYSQCAGFLVYDVQKIDLIWSYAIKRNLTDFALDTRFTKSTSRIDDQLVLRAAGDYHPPLMGMFPTTAWDVTVYGTGAPFNNLVRRRKGIKNSPKIKAQVLKTRPEIGMLHFNGGLESKDAYYLQHKLLKAGDHDDTFGMVKFYVQVPWSWARNKARSMIGLAGGDNKKGHPLRLNQGGSGSGSGSSR